MALEDIPALLCWELSPGLRGGGQPEPLLVQRGQVCAAHGCPGLLTVSSAHCSPAVPSICYLHPTARCMGERRETGGTGAGSPGFKRSSGIRILSPGTGCHWKESGREGPQRDNPADTDALFHAHCQALAETKPSALFSTLSPSMGWLEPPRPGLTAPTQAVRCFHLPPSEVLVSPSGKLRM